MSAAIFSSDKNFGGENVAYIDAANLEGALRTSGWSLNYRRFRVFLRQRYGVQRAYIFIGYISKYSDMYRSLQEAGYILVFKDVVYQNGKAKGNCDSDLVTKALVDLYEGNLACAVLVASDGDYTPMIKKMMEKGKFKIILSPAPPERCSILLKRTGAAIGYLGEVRHLIEYRHRMK